MTKFKVGQVVMYDRSAKKRGIAMKILEIPNLPGIEGNFYRIDRKNCVSEGMIRALTDEEKGDACAASDELVKALTKIRDHVDPCECDHSDENCCGNCDPIDFVCPFCIASIALAKAGRP